MLRHRGLFWSLALTALLGLTAREARAELISMTLIVGTGGGAVAIPVDPFATIDPLGKGYTVNAGATGLDALNAALNAAGSIYNFGTGTGTSSSALGGTSNFPGSSLGQLIVTGEIHSTGTGTVTALTLIEVEKSFTSPTGTSGTLMSSAGGNFTNQPAGGGSESNSMFNATSTPHYTVTSTGPGPNPGVNTGPVATPVAPVSTLYTLENIITWGITAPGLTKSTATTDISEGFSQSAVITAQTIPEPASLVMMLMGIPFPLAVLGLLRRRRGAAQG
jgi:hypothetical protein